MALTIDNLEIQIQSESKTATNGIEALTSSLEKLKGVVGNSSGLTSNLTQIAGALKSFSGLGKINLTSPVKQLGKLNDLVPTLGGGQATQLAQNLRDISGGLMAFSTVPKISITPIANGIKALNDATAGLDVARLEQFSSQMRGIAEGLSNLSNIGKTNIGSVVNSLKKIPEITAALKPEIITQFSAKVRELTAIMTPLAEQMDKIARGFSVLPNAINRANKASTQAVAQNAKAKNSYSSLSTTLSRTATKYMVLYYAATRIADIFADWLNVSNDYIESLNLFKVTMGDAADSALDFATKVRDAMGVDIAEWITNQGVFQRMATGFGIAADQANVMSQNLTQLAYDLSSFFNTDVETAMQKLQSGMSGQIKGLKAWGYNLSVAALQETALSLGIEQSVRTMTEAQKAQLRYITLIQKSNGIMGDMAKTLTTPANAMRILDSQFTQLKRALGDIVSVLITRFIPAIQAFVSLMTEAANTLAEIMGFEIKDLPTNNLDMGSDVIEGIGDVANDTEADLESLKKQLAGFDELNILKNNSKQDASYDLGIAMPSYDLLGDAKVSDAITKIKEEFLGLVETFKNSDFTKAFERIKELVENLKKQFTDLDIGTTFFEILTTSIESLGSAVNLVIQVFAPLVEALNIPQIVLDSLKNTKALLEAIGDVVTSVTPALTAFAEKGLAPIFKWLGGKVSQVINTVANAFGKIGNTFKTLEPQLTNIGTALGDFVSVVWELTEPFASAFFDIIVTDIEFLANALSGALNIVVRLLSALGTLWKNVLSPIAKFLVDTFSPIFDSLADGIMILTGVFTGDLNKSLVGTKELFKSTFGVLGSTVSAFFERLAQTSFGMWVDNNIVQPIKNLVLNVSQFASDCWNKIVEIFSPAISWFGELFGGIKQTLSDIFYNIGVIGSGCWTIIQTAWGTASSWFDETLIQPLSTAFSNMWTKFVEGAKNAWDGCKQVFSTLAEFFGGIFSKAWAKVVAVFSPLGENFVEIKDGILEGFRVIVNGLIKGLNKVIAIPFNGINNALSTLRNASIFNIKPFEGLKNINVPQIPLLASGGFPSMGQMFIARESGPELVGRIGNKNAVVNNEQIIQGIASAVYNAMMAAQEDGKSGNGGNARIILQIDGRAVGEASVNFINGQIIQTGTSPILT